MPDLPGVLDPQPDQPPDLVEIIRPALEHAIASFDRQTTSNYAQGIAALGEAIAACVTAGDAQTAEVLRGELAEIVGRAVRERAGQAAG